MRQEILTRRECDAMRGLAIIGIMLHNYCHFIGRIVKENEYQFLSINNDRLWQVLTSPDELLPVHLLSYFGHYGVPVFLFLSGYGLVRKYEHGEGAAALPFLRYHYLKLLRMLIVGFSLFLVVDAVTPGRWAFHWENVVAQLLMYINVLPDPDHTIWPGIYWFFGLMMQLYIVYRLQLYRRSSLWVGLLAGLCWLLQATCDPDGDTLNRLRYNCIGGLLPFGLGIVTGRAAMREAPHWLRADWLTAMGQRWILLLTAVLSAGLTVAMSFSFQAWLWIPVVIITGCAALVKALPDAALRPIVWTGGISAAMFVAHPIARKLFITVAWKQDIYDGLMLYVVATIALSWAAARMIEQIPKPRL